MVIGQYKVKNTKIRRNRESPSQNECVDKNTVSDGRHVFLNFIHLVEPQPVVVVGYSRRPVIRTYCAAV